MSTKHDSQCLANAADDEPIFVLRAKDSTAPETIRFWANRLVVITREQQLQLEGPMPDQDRLELHDLIEKRGAKIEDARRVALDMEAWAKKNRSKFPD